MRKKSVPRLALVAMVFTAPLAHADGFQALTWNGAGQVISVDTHVNSLRVTAPTTVLVEKNATLTVDYLAGGGALTKRGNGTLVIRDFDAAYANSGINVVKGSFRLGVLGGGIPYPIATRPWYRVDATSFLRNATHQTYLVNGNEVNYWEGVENTGGASSYNRGGVKPKLVFDHLGGRPVVDFGSYTTVWAEGAGLGWNNTAFGIGEAFVVAADTEDVIENDLDGQWYIGDESGRSSFIRGTGRRLSGSGGTDPDFHNGTFEIDGETATCDTVPGEGFHVVHFRAVSPKTRETGAYAWGWHKQGDLAEYGGIRIAEAMVFDGTISDADAAKVTEYLMAKWLGVGVTARLGSLTVSGDAVVEVPANGVLNVSTLRVDGELRKIGAGALHADALENSVGGVKAEEGSFTFGSASVGIGAAVDSLEVPAGSAVSAARVRASGTFTKKGGGALNAVVLESGVTNIAVCGGSLKVLADGGALPNGAHYHVDAMNKSKMFVNADDTCNFWEDLVDGSHSSWAWHANPHYSTAYLDGRPCADFGSYYSASAAPNGYGASFWWNCTTLSAKGVFVVFSDSDDVRESDTIAGQNIVGCFTEDSFNRGYNHTLLNGDLTGSASLTALRDNGVIEIDGVPASWSTILPKGFHVVHMRLPAGSSVGLCADSWGYSCYKGQPSDNAYYGGMMMSEGAIYTTDLTAEQVASATKFLLNKWFKQVRSGEYAFGKLTVSNGATLDLDGRSVSATGIGGDGTIEANAISLSENATLVVDAGENGAGTTTVSGSVSLPASGTIVFNGTMPKREAHYPILEAETLSGDVSGWTINPAGVPRNWMPSVQKAGNTVVLKFSPPATLLILR